MQTTATMCPTVRLQASGSLFLATPAITANIGMPCKGPSTPSNRLQPSVFLRWYNSLFSSTLQPFVWSLEALKPLKQNVSLYVHKSLYFFQQLQLLYTGKYLRNYFKSSFRTIPTPDMEAGLDITSR